MACVRAQIHVLESFRAIICSGRGRLQLKGNRVQNVSHSVSGAARAPLRLQGFLHHHWTKQPTSLHSSLVLDPRHGTLGGFAEGLTATLYSVARVHKNGQLE